MGEASTKWNWADGSSDPLDGALALLREADQVRDPRLREHPQICMSDEVEITIENPLDVMLRCEALDEELGCERGTHFEQFIAANLTSTSR